MVNINEVMYVDVGFCAQLDEIEQFFGEGLIDVENIIQLANENETEEWSKECLDIFKEIKQTAENKEFTGDVYFYN
jgi:hypothetical protein